MKKKALIITGIVAVAAIALLVFKPFSKKEADLTFETVKVERRQYFECRYCNRNRRSNNHS